jgi:hypothetical protein
VQPERQTLNVITTVVADGGLAVPVLVDKAMAPHPQVGLAIPREGITASEILRHFGGVSCALSAVRYPIINQCYSTLDLTAAPYRP